MTTDVRTKPELADLLKRVEEATDWDRALDLAIADACGLIPTGPGWKQTAADTWHKHLRWGSQRAEFDDCFQPRAYTASLDSAIELVEKVLPDWDICPAKIGGEWGAEVGPPDTFQTHGEKREGGYPTPALALCAALLRALIACDPRTETKADS